MWSYMIIEIQEKLLIPYMFSIRVWVVLMYLSWGSVAMSNLCLRYYVFTYSIGRALCKECLMSDEFAHSTIQWHIAVEIKKNILSNHFIECL